MPVDPNYHARMLLSRVPDEIRTSISSDELSDRLVESARLSAQANDQALSAGLRKAARLRAQAVLQAQPRLATMQQHAELIAKAAAAPHRGQAEALRRQAEELISERHPVAPQRGAAVRKAKADPAPDITPVFDADGQLIGVVDADKITRLSGKQPPPPPPAQDPAVQDPAAQPPAPDGQPVAKASGLQVVVQDQRGVQYRVDPRHIRKTASGPQASAAVAERFKRKATGQALPGDRDGDDQGHGTNGTPPEIQARRGSVRAGGTTGAGQPRKPEGAAATLAAAPQAKLPGDVPDRTVVKSAGWTDVHDYRGVRVGIVKQADIITAPAAALDGYVRKAGADNFANVYNSAGKRVGVALLPDILPLRPGR